MMEPHVELYRPAARFGWAVKIWKRDFQGKILILRLGEYREEWEELTDATAEVAPTFFAADDWLRELVRVYVEDNPPPAPDPRVEDVLQAALDDTRKVRDVIIEMLRPVAVSVLHPEER